jgi:ATP-binding cassette, subfamily C (CFTR/MRP), member 1
LTMSLFRIAELAHGNISIDGRNVADVDLPELRSAIDIVAQMPVLFKGRLRDYLDPLGEFPDSELWAALEKTNMKNAVCSFVNSSRNSSVATTATPGRGLDFELQEGSGNLSVGERQMMVLTRAVLRKSKILVLDEATAYVDYHTDRQVREVLKSEFTHSTVISIAHRIDSILHADKVLVLSAGKVVEYDSPARLLARTDGQFRSLAQEAGIDVEQHLLQLLPAGASSTSSSASTPDTVLEP